MAMVSLSAYIKASGLLASAVGVEDWVLGNTWNGDCVAYLGLLTIACTSHDSNQSVWANFFKTPLLHIDIAVCR